MTKKTLNLLSGLLMLSLIVVGAIFVTRTNYRQRLTGTTSTNTGGETTAASETYLPLVSAKDVTSADLSSLSISTEITVQNSSQVTAEGKPLEPEPFNINPLPIPPVPSFDSVSEQLDKINLEVVAKLEVPKSAVQGGWGAISWSADGTRFVGESVLVIDGKPTNPLYIGDVQTGALALWRAEGTYPIWGRDNKTIIYLKTRLDEPPFDVGNGWSRNRLDLVSGQVDSDQDDILLTDVVPPYYPVASYAQLADGTLLMLNSNHRLVIMPSPTELSDMAKQGIQPAPIADLSDVIGISEPSQLAMFDERDPGFSISPDGKKMVVVRLQQPAYLINILTNKVEAEIEGIDTPHNIAWRADSKSIAFTNAQGLHLYDVATSLSTRLVSKSNLGFADEDSLSGFSSPFWAFNDQVILFMASSSAWVKPGTEDRFENYTLAATSDGKYWKAISDSDLVSVSPSGDTAILRTHSSSETVFEVTKISR